MPRRKKTRTHKEITGATGAGKSTYLKSIVESVVSTGKPVGIIDPSNRKAKRKPKPKARPKRQQ